MQNKKQLSPELEPSYFQLQAHWGATKHMGGLKATNELIQLCHITKHNHILDIGCGTGITPTCIAKTHGCRVIGVDISKKMIERSKQRAKRNGVENRVEFIVADAQNLPLKPDTFDVVIGESVTAFLEDKPKAINEYVRVTKPGGYIGLNEATWIKTPPPTELVQYLNHTVGAKPETSDGWKELLEGSQLRNTVVRTYKANLSSEYINRIRQIGPKEFSKALYRFLSLYIRSPAMRKYTKRTWPSIPLRTFFTYFGYGIYVGRKQKR